ncbi:hypothetical protein [Endozoicomonas sp. ALC066]|uniref:hypothetical protein n=1 Tax=Endozoicomonas sp. ALC066 TaxID=3403078 RepID=UPI003BB650A3
MKRWKFKKPEDITAYWEYLKSIEMDYYLDGLPSEIFEKERIGIVNMTIVCANHDDLMTFCTKFAIDPWDYVEPEE